MVLWEGTSGSLVIIVNMIYVGVSSLIRVCAGDGGSGSLTLCRINLWRTVHIAGHVCDSELNDSLKKQFIFSLTFKFKSFFLC